MALRQRETKFVSLWRMANARNVRLYYPYCSTPTILYFDLNSVYMYLPCMQAFHPKTRVKLFHAGYLYLKWFVLKTSDYIPYIKNILKKTFIYFQTFVSFCSRGILGNLAEFFQCSFCGLVKYVRIDWKTEFSYEKYRQRGKQTV